MKCPFLMTHMYDDCRECDCALWDDYNNCCSLKSFAIEMLKYAKNKGR